MSRIIGRHRPEPHPQPEANKIAHTKIGEPARSKINLHFQARFEDVVKKAKKRFPDHTVWGSHIHEGHGYAVFISDGVSISCFQVRSLVLIDGVPKANDVMEADEPERSNLISSAFDAIEKSLVGNTARVNERKGLNGQKVEQKS